MADDLDALHRLAPEVDIDRAKVAFRRRRGRARSLRRGLMAATAVTVLVSGTVAVVVNIDDDAPVVAGPREEVPTGPITFEVLTVARASDQMGTLRSATDDGGYVNLWKYANAGEPRPGVDFDEQVVVSITIPDNACPPELTAFDRDGGVITPVFVEPEGGCDDPLIPKTYVVALDRSTLGATFTLRLPASDVYGYAEQRMMVVLEPGEISHGGFPTVWAQDPTPSAEGMAAEVTGTLRYDSENDCFLLDQGELSYPVVWPAGTVGAITGPGVVLPDGQAARVGDELYGGGGYLDVADDYGIPDACLPDTREVAVYNPNEAVAVNTGTDGNDERHGRVAGRFLAVGGPYGTAETPLSGTITATSMGGGNTTVVATGGVFEVELPAGTYTFTGVSPQYQASDSTCPAAGPVYVDFDVTATVEVVCERK